MINKWEKRKEMEKKLLLEDGVSERLITFKKLSQEPVQTAMPTMVNIIDSAGLRY